MSPFFRYVAKTFLTLPPFRVSSAHRARQITFLWATTSAHAAKLSAYKWQEKIAGRRILL
jgi:hypothetical protein